MSQLRASGIAALVALAALVAPCGGSAQPVRPPTVLDCDVQLLLAPPPDTLAPFWKAQYTAVRIVELAHLGDTGQWQALLDSTRQAFDRSILMLVPATSQSDPRLIRFRTRLDSLRSLVRALGPRLQSVTQLRAASAALRQAGRDVMRPEVRDGVATLFRGTPDVITLSDADDSAVRRAVCYNATLTSHVLDRMTADLRAFATEVLLEKERRWTSYFDRGYSQLPWELYLNSRRARDGSRLDPPTRQIIFMHPSVGVQLAGVTWKDIKRHDAILVEPLGWISYRNDYRSYFGVSGVIAFVNQQGTSSGPLIHFGRVAKVGYLFPLGRDAVSGTRRDGGILVSVDLYKFLSDRQSMVQQTIKSFRDRIAALP